MSLKEDISMKVNGRSQVPPGFRFHPTEEELLHYYLRKKIAYEKIDLDVIREVDLNKLEPWDIQEKCNIGSTPQNDWYFFSHKDKKYPTGTRTNRATAAGFWKATGRDKVVYSSLKRIGMRKTLVFYKGRAPHGLKSDWIMHEYRLDDIINIIPTQDLTVSNLCDCGHEEGWVVCRVFKKKNYHKSLESTQRSSLIAASMDTEPSHLESLNNNNDVVLDQLLGYIDTSSRSCKQENSENFTHINHVMQQFVNPITNDNAFLHLPRLDSPGTMTTFVPPLSSPAFDQVEHTRNGMVNDDRDHDHQCIGNWVDLDRFVASQLNGQLMESSKHLFSCYGEPNEYEERDLFGYTTTVRPNEAACTSEVDIWSLAKIPSSVDPLCHLSV